MITFLPRRRERETDDKERDKKRCLGFTHFPKSASRNQERERERKERDLLMIDAWVLCIFRDLRTSAISEPPGIPKT
jgi:hypothetical protein